MDDALAEGLASGLLGHLTRLQAQSRALAEAQRDGLRRARRKRALRAELSAAQAREARLRRRAADKLPVEAPPDSSEQQETVTFIGTVADAVLEHKAALAAFRAEQDLSDGQTDQRSTDDAGLLAEDGAALAQIRAEARENSTRRARINRILAYRLAGVSLFRTRATNPADRLVGVRFDTSYQGRFFERYYAIFGPGAEGAEGPEANTRFFERLDLVRHTLPHFVPADALFAEHDLADFCRIVLAYLNAFVSRRQQLEEAVRALAERGRVSYESSAPCDMVLLRVARGGGVDALPEEEEVLKVQFGTLLARLPDSVEVKTGEGKATFELEEGRDIGPNFRLQDFVLECLQALD